MSKVLAKVLGEEFIMLENNEIVRLLQTGSLVIDEITTVELFANGKNVSKLPIDPASYQKLNSKNLSFTAYYPCLAQ
jgi:hypothetical protein